MKKVWIEIGQWDVNLVTGAIESGADAFFTASQDIVEKIRGLARVEVYRLDALPDHIRFILLSSKEDEEGASRLSEQVTLIIEATHWKIIPLENLIAARGNLFACAGSLEDALEAVNILEKGVDGIYVRGCGTEETLEIIKKVKSCPVTIDLSKARVVSLQKLPLGDRVCIDTITSMIAGEGMLVGDYSHGMALVHCECLENPYVTSRPFRVNAGAVHCYSMIPGGKTKYLSDFKSADEVLIVNSSGQTVTSAIGRIKRERRPMIRIELKGLSGLFSVVLQNAETVRLITNEGVAKSIVTLEPGDTVLVHEESGGRHFGHKVSETIAEH